MKVLKSGRFGQNQAHSPALVIFGQKGLEIGGGDMIWPSLGLAPVHEEPRITECAPLAVASSSPYLRHALTAPLEQQATSHARHTWLLAD
jgi:hypothetical protein